MHMQVTRRQFLTGIGVGSLVATIPFGLAKTSDFPIVYGIGARRGQIGERVIFATEQDLRSFWGNRPDVVDPHIHTFRLTGPIARRVQHTLTPHGVEEYIWEGTQPCEFRFYPGTSVRYHSHTLYACEVKYLQPV
jgi:hypothetical protein